MKKLVKTKRKKIWKMVIVILVAITIVLLTFFPVAGFIYDISTCHYSTGYYGPMGGPMVDQSATNVIFYFLMTAYLSLIVVASIRLCKVIKK